MDVIFDLDGTLADLTHRRHFVAARPKNWKAFFAGVEHDAVIEPVATALRQFAAGAHRVIVCSGRPDDLREATERWLARHELWHSGLYMRRAGDYRADDVVKEELLDQILVDGFAPELVFDDRDRVVKMWRRRGLVCAQVAEGDF